MTRPHSYPYVFQKVTSKLSVLFTTAGDSSQHRSADDVVVGAKRSREVYDEDVNQGAFLPSPLHMYPVLFLGDSDLVTRTGM